MLTRSNELEIFETFRIDLTLPKYSKKIKSSTEESFGDDSIQQKNGFTWSRGVANSIVLSANDDRILVERSHVKSIFEPLLSKIYSFFKPENKTLPITVEEFFRSAKNSAEELVIVESRAAGYEAALKKTKEAGQTALFEKLSKCIDAVRAETQMVAAGITKYITEETLVRLVTKNYKMDGLRLDWIANFTRFIPDDVLKTKRTSDERELFDNYVILHYDPLGRHVDETEEQKAARKDPVLFGVLEGRRRLYFIGDWKDEFCDLTFDQIAETMGKEHIGDLEKESF